MIVYILFLGINWTLVTILMVTERNFVELFDEGNAKLLMKFVPKLGISFINAAAPLVVFRLTLLENWDSPAYAVKLNIIRLYLLKVLNAVLFALLNLELLTDVAAIDGESRLEFESDTYNCRED